MNADQGMEILSEETLFVSNTFYVDNIFCINIYVCQILKLNIT